MNSIEIIKKLKEGIQEVKELSKVRGEYPILQIITIDNSILVDQYDNFEINSDHCFMYIEKSLNGRVFENFTTTTQKYGVKIKYKDIESIEVYQ